MSGVRIALISCSSQKADEPALAKDLYTSALFRKSRAWAEVYCHAWGILSARHGLVLPYQEIRPYDWTLRDLSAEQRTRWGDQVRREVTDWWGMAPRYYVLAGELYAQELRRIDGLNGITTFEPLKGLQIGERLAWLNNQLSHCGVV